MTFPVFLQGKYFVSDELCLKTCDNGMQKRTNSTLTLSFVTVIKIGEALKGGRNRSALIFTFSPSFRLPVDLFHVAGCFLQPALSPLPEPWAS